MDSIIAAMHLSPIEPVYGPLLIGVMLNVLLFGVMITQTYLYAINFKADKPWIKYFVWILFIANTLKTGFDIAYVYQRFIQNFGDVPALMEANWVFNTDPAMTGIIACMVQFFFAWRVKVLTSSNILTALIVVLAACSVLSGIATAVACGIVKHFVDFQQFQVVVILWLGCAALTDTIIAIALALTLKKNRTGFAATDDVIDRLIRTTVQTGALTAIIASIDLITFLTSTSGLHLAFNFPLAHLYTNSLLSSLNARAIGKPSSSRSAGASSGSEGRSGVYQRRMDYIDMDSNLKIRPQETHVVMRADLESGEDVSVTPTKVFMQVEEVTVTS